MIKQILLLGNTVFFICLFLGAGTCAQTLKKGIYIQEDSDLQQKLNGALQEEEKGHPEKAFALYQEILPKVEAFLTKATFPEGANKPIAGLYVGMAEFIRRRMAAMPLTSLPEHSLLRGRAAQMYEKATKKGDPSLLLSLIEKYPFWSFEESAFTVLGDLYFSLGRLDEAIGIWQRLLLWKKGQTKEAVHQRLATASLLYGDESAYTKFSKSFPSSPRLMKLEELLSSSGSTPLRPSFPQGWLSSGGNTAHNIAAEGIDFTDKKLSIQVRHFAAPDYIEWNQQIGTQEPSAKDGRLYYYYPSEVFCFSPGAFQLEWNFALFPRQERGFAQYVGALDQDRFYIISPAAGALQNVSTGTGNSVYCFSTKTGAQLWHWPHDAKQNMIFHGAPLVVGQRLYLNTTVLTGQMNAEVVCLDITVLPKILWRRFLGSIILTEDAKKQEHDERSSPLTRAYGLVYACTNLGILAALDEKEGEIRWLLNYQEQLPKKYRLRQNYPPVSRLAKAPIARNGKIYAMPMDSHHIVVCDAYTGALCSIFPDSQYEGNIRELIGVGPKDEIYLATSQEIMALRRNGQEEILWQTKLPYPIVGQCLFTKSWIYALTTGPAFFQISTKNGKVDPIRSFPKSKFSKTPGKILPPLASSLFLWERQGIKEMIIAGPNITVWTIEK